MVFKMRYTNGKKADASVFPFKKEEKHFLERNAVGPIANNKEEEDDKNIEFTQSGSPVIPAPEEKVLDASSYILSKQEKSKKKKY